MRFEDFTTALKKDRPMQIGVIAFVIVGLNLIGSMGGTARDKGAASRMSCDTPPARVTRQADRNPVILRLPATKQEIERAVIANIIDRPVFVCDENQNWYQMNRPEGDVSGKELADTLRKVSTLVCEEADFDSAAIGIPDMTEDQRRIFCEAVPDVTDTR